MFFTHMQPWITVENLRFFLDIALPINFVLTLSGVTIGFCGPLDHKLTEWCRARYLSHSRHRATEVWLTYVVPLMMAICILMLYNAGWFINGMFLSFSLALRFLRAWMLKRFPERGYLRQRFVIVREDSLLKLISK